MYLFVNRWFYFDCMLFAVLFFSFYFFFIKFIRSFILVLIYEIDFTVNYCVNMFNVLRIFSRKIICLVLLNIRLCRGGFFFFGIVIIFLENFICNLIWKEVKRVLAVGF